MRLTPKFFQTGGKLTRDTKCNSCSEYTPNGHIFQEIF